MLQNVHLFMRPVGAYRVNGLRARCAIPAAVVDTTLTIMCDARKVGTVLFRVGETDGIVNMPAFLCSPRSTFCMVSGVVVDSALDGLSIRLE